MRSFRRSRTRRSSPRIYSDMAGPHYLLDTNVLSAVVKRPRRELARRIAAMNRGEYCTSIVVACELRYGVRKKGSQGLAAKVEQLLASIDVLPLEAGSTNTMRRYGWHLSDRSAHWPQRPVHRRPCARPGFDAGHRQPVRVFPRTKPCGRELAGGGCLNACTSRSPSSTSSPRSAGR